MARTERSERRRRERVGRAIRTLLGLFFVSFVVAAVLSPPSPLVFTVLLVVGWLVSIPVTFVLVFRGGDARLRASRFYRPGGRAASRAVLLFAVVAVGLKLAGLVLVATLTSAGTPSTGLDAFVSTAALLVGYLVAFQRGPPSSTVVDE